MVARLQDCRGGRAGTTSHRTKEGVMDGTAGEHTADERAEQREGPVLRATGRTLPEWFSILDERGASDLAHKDIARILSDGFGVSGWWSQHVTVEYEKHIGRRETGQRQSGEYEGTASRTFPGTMEEVLERWLRHLPVGAGASFDGVEFAGEPAVSRTDKWRYWRVTLADRSRVTVTITDRPGGPARRGGPASTLAVTSGRLPTRDDSLRWKTFWRAYLDGL
jgi:hypothetical protein